MYFESRSCARQSNVICEIMKRTKPGRWILEDRTEETGRAMPHKEFIGFVFF